MVKKIDKQWEKDKKECGIRWCSCPDCRYGNDAHIHPLKFIIDDKKEVIEREYCREHKVYRDIKWKQVKPKVA